MLTVKVGGLITNGPFYIVSAYLRYNGAVSGVIRYFASNFAYSAFGDAVNHAIGSSDFRNNDFITSAGMVEWKKKNYKIGVDVLFIPIPIPDHQEVII